jgi:hypothetical protein
VGSDVCQGALQFLSLSCFFAWGGLAVSHRENVKRCTGVVVGGVISSLPYHYHRAGDLLGVGYDAVEDGVDCVADVVLRVLVGAIGVVNRLRAHLLCWAQGAIGAES